MGLFFIIFVFSIQLTISIQNKILPMTGFKLWNSGAGSDSSTSWATTTAHTFKYLSKLSLKRDMWLNSSLWDYIWGTQYQSITRVWTPNYRKSFSVKNEEPNGITLRGTDIKMKKSIEMFFSKFSFKLGTTWVCIYAFSLLPTIYGQTILRTAGHRYTQTHTGISLTHPHSFDKYRYV